MIIFKGCGNNHGLISDSVYVFVLKDLSNQSPPEYQPEESSLEPSYMAKWNG